MSPFDLQFVVSLSKVSAHGSHVNGVTLAASIRERRPGLSWSDARALCIRGFVWVNGAVSENPAHRVQLGDEVRVVRNASSNALGRSGGKYLEGQTPVELLYVDREVVVVNKPAGMLSVPYEGPEKNTLIDEVRVLLRKAQRERRASSCPSVGLGGSTERVDSGPRSRGRTFYDPQLGIVHRLDKGTSGVMMFARTLAAKKVLQTQFRSHTIGRRYLAIAMGRVPKFTADTLIIRDRGDGLRGSWGRFRKAHDAFKNRPPADAKRAITHLSPLETFKRGRLSPETEIAYATMVECMLETGRQHQIRIHLSEAGHPLLGETVYIRDVDLTRFGAGSGPTVSAPSRPMLHAVDLAFDHPKHGKRMEFSVQPPTDFSAVLNALRSL